MDKAEAAMHLVATVEAELDESEEDDGTGTHEGARMGIGDKCPRAMVERGGVTYERLRAYQAAPRAGTQEPASLASTSCAFFMNRRMPNGTYGGVGGRGR